MTNIKLLQLNQKNLEQKPSLKKLIKDLKNSSGQSNSGKITIRNKGNKHKQNFIYNLIN